MQGLPQDARKIIAGKHQFHTNHVAKSSPDQLTRGQPTIDPRRPSQNRRTYQKNPTNTANIRGAKTDDGASTTVAATTTVRTIFASHCRLNHQKQQQ